jgi:methylenetetrahydrofolate reductase (NADPH)
MDHWVAIPVADNRVVLPVRSENTRICNPCQARIHSFFEELAAKQVAVLRGLGYRGVYLSGRLPLSRIRRVLELEESFGPDDWRDFAKEIQFQKPGEFNFYERDPVTGLASDQINPEYLESKSPKGLKQAGKIQVFGCRDCGDCSLPDIAYLCPESQCVKNQRNGPCGGSQDGQCEIGEKRCIWVKAYERTKPYGEESDLLERPVVFKNGALSGTSAWANTFLDWDHNAPDRPESPD